MVRITLLGIGLLCAIAFQRWSRGIASVILAVMLGGVAHAQSLPIDRLTPPLPTQTERTIADVVSWGTVATTVALDLRESWRADDRAHALKMQAVRLGVVWGSSALVKALVQRERPCAPACGIDRADASYFSAHTAFAFSTIGGPRLSIAVPLSVSTGGLRIAADKHWLTDVLTGAGVGWLTSHIR